MNLSVSLFTSPSKEGMALESQLKEDITYYLHLALERANLLTNKRFQNLVFKVTFSSIKRCASENEFLKAQLEDDLVIFDGSLEDDGLKLGDNYSCTGHAPYLMDNVMVVSRTVLPINYIPNTTNVHPVGEGEKNTDQSDRLIIKKSYTNEEIGLWLTNTFCEWVIDGRLPRKSEYKRNLPPLEVLFDGKNDERAVQWFVKELTDVSEKTKIYSKNRYEHTAFISYRSFYAMNKSNGYSVEDLKQYILDYHKGLNPDEKWNVLYYSQGTLAQDCMTEYRRWGLMTYVDNIFKDVPEVWILNTHDTQYGPSYWDSWFTQSEIISLMMLHQELPQYCPKIIEFDTSLGKHHEIKSKELPKIKGDNKYYLDVITANSEIFYGDYSGLVGMQMIKEKMREMSAEERMPLSKQLSKQLGFDLEKAFKSHSYDSSFMSSRIVSCRECLKKGFSFDSFTDPDFIGNFYNIGSDDPEEEKMIAQRGYFSLSDLEFQNALKSGIMQCPNCSKEFHIKEMNDCLYIWRHKFKNPAIDFDGYIEKVALYYII